MSKMFGLDINAKSMTTNLNKFFKKIDPQSREKALIAAGLELINFVVNGSPNEPIRPPIKYGRLRGSGAVFLGNRKVGDTLFAGASGTPASSSGENNPEVITVGFNTPYAARMHEHMAPATKKDPWFGIIFYPHRDAGSSGGKFLESHLKADAKEFGKTYSEQYRKFAGT